MKLGIFGDSFARPSQPSIFMRPSKPGDLMGWPEYIQESNPDIRIDNYAVGKSSMYYTWKQFCIHQHKYDKIIVCATDESRLWLPHFPQQWNATHMNWVCVEDALADQNKDLPENIKTALLLYYTHIINKDQDKDMHRLMATDMNNMRSDLLYFDCFHIPNFGLSKYLPLMSISNLDKKINRFKKHGGRQSLPIDDDRPNHMNDKNNRIFAQKITHWINTSQFEMDITEFSKED